MDDIAFVRSMYTTDNDHGAEFQMHTGRHTLDEQQPAIGVVGHYGLGTLNENLPQFVFLGQYKDARVKKDFAADYLGPRHAGVELSLDPANPLPFATRGKGVLAKEQQGVFDFANELNGLAAAEYPDDEQTKARIKAYELAYRMQKAVPEVLDLRRPSRCGQARSPTRGPTISSPWAARRSWSRASPSAEIPTGWSGRSMRGRRKQLGVQVSLFRPSRTNPMMAATTPIPKRIQYSATGAPPDGAPTSGAGAAAMNRT